MAPIFAGLRLASETPPGVLVLRAGGLKNVYDLILFRALRTIKPPAERAPS